MLFAVLVALSLMLLFFMDMRVAHRFARLVRATVRRVR